MRICGYRVHVIIADLIAIGSVAGLLFAIHLLVPPAIHSQLTLIHDSVEPITLLTAAYVHLTDGHLQNNLLGYGSVAIMVYLTCLQIHRRRWFWTSVVALLLIVPVLVSLSSYVILTVQYPTAMQIESRGFSGVVSGFAGFLFVALVAWVRTFYTGERAAYVGQIVAITLAAELLIIYTNSLSIVEVTLLSVGIGLPLAALGYRTVTSWESSTAALSVHGALDTGYVVLVSIMLGAVVYGLFPEQIVTSGTVTNIYAHFAGFVWGALLAWMLEPIT